MWFRHSGGDPERDQMIVYDMENDEFRNYGDDFLLFLGNDHGEYGSVFYSQINASTLFTVRESGDHIHVYDLNPESLSFHILEQSIPIFVGDAACLTSSETPSPRLYITGGHQNNGNQPVILSHFQILDLDENSWYNGSDMTFARYHHGCIVVNDTLWVLGTVPEIEIMDTMDIYNSTWSIHSDLSLDVNISHFGITIFQTFMYIVGGWISDYDSGHDSNIVYIIDTESNLMTYATLSSAVSAVSLVSVQDNLYAFGGRLSRSDWWSGSIWNSWLSYEALSALLSKHQGLNAHSHCR